MRRRNVAWGCIVMWGLWLGSVVFILLLALWRIPPTLAARLPEARGTWDTCLVCLGANPAIAFAILGLLFEFGAGLGVSRLLPRSTSLRLLFVAGGWLYATLPLMLTPFWWPMVGVWLVAIALPLWFLVSWHRAMGLKQFWFAQPAALARTLTRHAIAARARGRSLVAAHFWECALLMRWRSRRLTKGRRAGPGIGVHKSIFNDDHN